MADFNFDELKQKAMATVSNIVDKSAAIGKKAVDKGSELAKKAKLNAEIAAERETMKKQYQALGKLYYEKYGENADPDFVQAIEELGVSMEKINEKLAALEELKADDVEVEIVEEKAEDACDEAADKVDEVKEAVADAVEDAKEVVADVVEEAKEKVEEIIDEVKND